MKAIPWHKHAGIAPNEEAILEDQARKALEERLGRRCSEDEWGLYSSRLIAFARLLREWQTTE